MTHGATGSSSPITGSNLGVGSCMKLIDTDYEHTSNNYNVAMTTSGTIGEAQLEARRQELANLQQRIRKAEVCRRSQVSGEKERSQRRREEASDESASASNSRSASQELVRSLTDPHSPLWLSGQHYPAQYLIRQTRSMSRAQRGIITMPRLPPSGAMAVVKDFDLPDDDAFYQLKQQRLRESPLSCCDRQITCQLVDNNHGPIELKCTRHIQCAPGEVLPCEGTDGKLIVKEGGSFAVLFADRFSFCRGNSSDDCYSHSLSKPIICFDCLTAEKGDVLIAIAHPGEIAVIVHTEGRLENVSLPVPTDSLAWPKDFACRYLRMSEFPVGSVLIAAYYCGVVCVWSISLEPFHCDVASSFSIPHLSSLFLLHDWLLAATTDNRLLVWSCVSAGSLGSPSREVPLSRSSLMREVPLSRSSLMREVPLSCCPSDDQQSPRPLILAAADVNNCLLIVLTLEWSGDPRLSEAGAAWVIALRDGHSIPYLLHTYHRPYTTSDGPLVLQAYTPLNKPWRLVGVADSKQLLVWKGNEDILPSVAVRLEGESVSDMAWDALSNSCLILDKSRQVHIFQNTTHNCSQ